MTIVDFDLRAQNTCKLLQKLASVLEEKKSNQESF
jgi:hypothetical protein